MAVYGRNVMAYKQKKPILCYACFIPVYICESLLKVKKITGNISFILGMIQISRIERGGGRGKGGGGRGGEGEGEGGGGEASENYQFLKVAR
jgi:hypothetical protein